MIPVLYVLWSEREDLNLRPLGPEPSALPSCATPRYCKMIIAQRLLKDNSRQRRKLEK
jgi:hypothetical protein